MSVRVCALSLVVGRCREQLLLGQCHRTDADGLGADGAEGPERAGPEWDGMMGGEAAGK